MKQSSHTGFTLIELIVSLGLFSMVIVVAAGSYMSLIALDREVRISNELVTNLSFAVDSMSRSIRTGTEYKCTPGDSNGNSISGNCHEFSYKDYKDCTITYRNSGGTLVQSISGTGCSVGTDIPLTDSRIKLSTTNPQGLTFYVTGIGQTGSEAAKQPTVFFSLSGEIEEVQGQKRSFTIESRATQRYIDL
jgi:prepilin-type N-terminal cleavage/methylation domain-containing protein